MNMETRRHRLETWKHEEMETRRHGHGDKDMDTRKHEHGDMNMETWTLRQNQTINGSPDHFP
jgi:ABC-type Zn2+ transport system substrate-binding protein/surface adhesin